MFDSLVDAARHGDYELLGCRRRAGGGAIEYQPHAWPFGGTGWMHAVITAFGGKVTRDSAA